MGAIRARIDRALRRERLVETAVGLVSIPSPTGQAGAVSDRLAHMLGEDGFEVHRVEAGHAPAPAVVAWHRTGRPGPTIQFDGHLDTVHLPFVPPRVEGDRITGSGSADMKAGLAAAVEAMRALRDTDLLPGGNVLVTAHDLHETPWGDGSQLEQLIAEGHVGAGVLLPEYLNDRLPVIGRGGMTWKMTIRRPGPAVHEVFRPRDEPNVIEVGAGLVNRLLALDQEVSGRTDPLAGSESVFIGQIHSGEIFNQYPAHCWLEGTRRWLPGTSRQEVEEQLRRLAAETGRQTGTAVDLELHLMRDAFVLDQESSLVRSFQAAYAESAGKPLSVGAKPFCDDGNTFWALARVPAITHGPNAGGAHTLNEWVSIDDLVRVARVYALTAVAFCGG